MVIAIRAATSEDIDAVVELWDRAAGPSRQPGRHFEVHRLIAADPDSLLVADQDGRILGTVIVGWDGWRCHLYRLAVNQDVRRTGTATALMKEATKRAKALGATRLDAMVSVENSEAVAFWEQFGFQLDPDDGRWSMLL
jgi:ribosomal protein S18 acetylase RimI-like enzyme